MTELERALVQLGGELDLPPTPDLARAVRPRLQRRRRLWLVPVVAALVALGVALAIPDSRAAILRFFHLGAVEVTIVDTLPELPANAYLGAPIEPQEAVFRLRLLDGERPLQVYAYERGYWLRYRGVLLYELRTGDAVFLKKVAAGGAAAYVDVGGRPGLWIGARHGVYLPGGEARVADHVLVWQDGPLTLRLEGRFTRAEAIRLALKVR